MPPSPLLCPKTHTRLALGARASRPLRRSMRLALAMLCLALSPPTQAQDPQRRISLSHPRVALVIGNSKYTPGALRNPVNDATDMAATLTKLGFTVTRLLDADKAQIDSAVDTLTQQLRQGPETVGLFYFAGHGTLVDGHNYLLPVGTAINTPTDVKHRAVAAEWVLERMEETGNALNVLILDACRDNPFARQWRSGPQGLGTMSPGQGKQTLIAFATLPGKVAADLSGGRNSPYTTHLLQHLGAPGLDVGEVFQRVRVGVKRDTGGQQTPQEWTTMEGKFYLGAAPEAVTAPSLPVRDPEEAAWQMVEQTTHMEDVKAFVQAYPKGRFATAAALKLSQLQRAAAGTQVAVGVPPEPVTTSGKTLRNALGMEFVRIPAGEFRMGSKDKDADADEKPVHTVRLTRAFYLGKYEVTQGQWQEVMGSNPSRFPGDANRPVEQVSWDDVQEFIQRLNAREGGTPYRLPTDAEWEYAARAGSTTAYSFGNEVGQLGAYAWYDANAGGTTHPVGQKQPNAWGLYDMHGNVSERVQDWYGPYTAATAVDPAGPAAGATRVVRGGSWLRHARNCRSAYGYGAAPVALSDGLGVRLLRTAP